MSIALGAGCRTAWTPQESAAAEVASRLCGSDLHALAELLPGPEGEACARLLVDVPAVRSAGAALLDHARARWGAVPLGPGARALRSLLADLSQVPIRPTRPTRVEHVAIEGAEASVDVIIAEPEFRTRHMRVALIEKDGRWRARALEDASARAQLEAPLAVCRPVLARAARLRELATTLDALSAQIADGTLLDARSTDAAVWDVLIDFCTRSGIPFRILGNA